VDITVNGETVPFNMKIGEAGEAFFVFETDSDVPDDLITSPLLEPTEVAPTDPVSLGVFGRFGARDHGDGFTDAGIGQEPDFLDLNAPSTSPSGEASKASASSHVSQSAATIVNTRNATLLVTIEAEKEVPQEVHDDPLETSKLAVSYDGRMTQRMPNMEKLDDEAHPRLCVEDFSTSHSSGGMSCPTFSQCNCDSGQMSNSIWGGITPWDLRTLKKCVHLRRTQVCFP
jgi:phosphatidate phosphatase LPIN